LVNKLNSFSKLEIDFFLFLVSNKIVATVLAEYQEYAGPIDFKDLYQFLEVLYFF